MIADAMITHTTRALLVSLSLALSACGGALAAWWVRETRCRNIWQG